ILDVCALAMVGLEGMCRYQAKMTFAMARHALVDLSQVFAAPPDHDGAMNRLPPADLVVIRERLTRAGMRLSDGEHADLELARLRKLYEPFAIALARHLRLTLPPWIKRDEHKDNWQTSAWRQTQQAPQTVTAHDDHF